MSSDAEIHFCSNDGSWGPGSSCRTLDFTLEFQFSTISLPVDLVFCTLAVCNLLWNYQTKSRASLPPSPYRLLLLTKVIAGVLILGASLANAVAQSTYGSRTLLYPAQALAQTSFYITFLASLLLLILTHQTHRHSVAPNALILVYMLTRTLVGITLVRSYAAIGFLGTLGAPRVLIGLLILRTALCMVVFLAESIERHQAGERSGEETASILTRPLFLWLLPTLMKGRTTRLQMTDLQNIPQQVTAVCARNPLEERLKHHRPSLLSASVRAYLFYWMAPVAARVLLVLATFAQPLLVNDMLEFVTTVGNSPGASKQRGWAIVGGFVCVYWLLWFSTCLYYEKMYENTVQYRAALVSTVYAKTLRLAPSVTRGSNTDDSKATEVGPGDLSTLMSVDVERVSTCFENLHECWAALLSTALAVAILWTQVGWPAFLPLPIIIFTIVASSYNAQRVRREQAQWLSATGKRVSLLTFVIQRLLPIKWSTYEKTMADKVSDLRAAEMRFAQKFYSVVTITSTLAHNAEALCLFVLLAVYAGIRNGEGLDPQTLFTLSTTVSLLSEAVGGYGLQISSLLAGYASLKRVESFLLLDEKESASDDMFQSLAGTSEEPEKVDGSTPSPSTPSAPTASLPFHPMEKTPASNSSSALSSAGEPAVALSRASFAWVSNAPPFLQGLSASFESGGLHVILGRVGSGKSMMLRALLGETILTSGTLKLSSTLAGRIAYAAQNVFVSPGTIRDNILFGRVFDEERYNIALSACALETDLANIAEGDLTMVAEGGTNLSGGQRQRIALARVVYSLTPLTLLDDSFSALDATTEAHVVNKLFGQGGLLRAQTVILSTNSHRLMPFARSVTVLDQGKILYHGTPDEIRQQGFRFDDFEPAQNTMASKSSSPTRETKSSQLEEKGKSAGVVSQGPASGSNWSAYLFLGRMAGWSTCLISASIIIIWGAQRYGAQGLLEQWSTSNPDNWRRFLGGYGALMLLGLFLCAATVLYLTQILIPHLSIRLHTEQLSSLLAATPLYIMTTPASLIVNRFSQDIFAVDYRLPFAALNIVAQTCWFIAALVLTFLPVPWLTLSIFVLVPAYYVMFKFYLATSTQLQALEAESKTPLYALFPATLSGLETIRAFEAQSKFQQEVDTALNLSQGPYYYRYAGLRFLRAGLSVLAFIVAVALSILTVALASSTSAAMLGLSLSNLTMLSTILSYALQSYANMENSIVSIDRIREIVSLPPESPSSDSTGGDKWKELPTSVATSIVFDRVSVRFKQDFPLVLKEISFDVKAGQKVAICGRTGSGKSTVAMTLLRAFDASLMSGRVFVDGIDANETRMSAWRSQFSVVTQDPFLWPESVRSNLDPHSRRPEADLWDALDKVGLRESVDALPSKMDTDLQDEGTLSRGQRQLLCLARMLLQEKQIIVLDEATSSLDSTSSEKINRILNEHVGASENVAVNSSKSSLKSRMVLAIAHRIASIVDFDEVLVLEEGTIVERGPPKDLLKDQNSKFFALAAGQGVVG